MPKKFIKQSIGFLEPKETRDFCLQKRKLANLQSFYYIISENNITTSNNGILKEEIEHNLQEAKTSFSKMFEELAKKYKWSKNVKKNFYFRETGEVGYLKEI